MKSNTILQTSVVLATYNGEKYIEEQLFSIYNQTRAVDEVLIVDDRSTDSTIEICKSFIKDNKPENWSIKVNDVRLGVFENFMNGVLTSKGDVIFFADQDDIWSEEKVNRMVAEFENHPDMLSLTTTFSRFEGNTIFSPHVKHPKRKPNGLKLIRLSEFCAFPYYLGMSMAISKKLIKKIDFTNEVFKSISKKQLVHDIFFNFISTLNDGHYHLDMVLTERRSYSKSVSNLKYSGELVKFDGNFKLLSIHNKIKQIELFVQLVSLNKKEKNSEEYLKIIYEHLSLLKVRFNYIKDANFILWLKSIKYVLYFGSFLNYLSDGMELLKTKIKLKIK